MTMTMTPTPWTAPWTGFVGPDGVTYYPISGRVQVGYPAPGKGLVALALTEGDQQAIATAVSAFKELLAVAKACDEDTGGNISRATISKALLALDSAHPGWREWTP